MAHTEKFIDDHAKRLDEFCFEIDQLKTAVEKQGLGSDSEWIRQYEELIEKVTEIRLHLKYIAKKANPMLRKIARLHITLLIKDLRDDFCDKSEKYNHRHLSNDFKELIK